MVAELKISVPTHVADILETPPKPIKSGSYAEASRRLGVTEDERTRRLLFNLQLDNQRTDAGSPPVYRWAIRARFPNQLICGYSAFSPMFSPFWLSTIKMIWKNWPFPQSALLLLTCRKRQKQTVHAQERVPAESNRGIKDGILSH